MSCEQVSSLFTCNCTRVNEPRPPPLIRPLAYIPPIVLPFAHLLHPHIMHEHPLESLTHNEHNLSTYNPPHLQCFPLRPNLVSCVHTENIWCSLEMASAELCNISFMGHRCIEHVGFYMLSYSFQGVHSDISTLAGSASSRQDSQWPLNHLWWHNQ